MQVSGQPHAPAALPTGNEVPALKDQELSGPQNRSGHFGENRYFTNSCVTK